ncbi:hypothetical protein DLM76_20765 [Leptospira yasudae]|uniref:hypothetical protein n=1 Tax=Leptospira TaxID=171 RepID=UPI0002BDB5E7|nr:MULTISPECIES: hypothetical protein [Leptospira]EMK01090.1 hypothetical protein LEP1GSC192_3633 [Leptospira sp. B5-022]MCR1795707.1 hypothetical protein [Leptospira sp. id769339]RHX90158.1 hypothetical protein DLM76_20765 [Leptospira yasudae]
MNNLALRKQLTTGNYPLQAYKILGDEKGATLTATLIEFITDVYRGLEPSHYQGKLLIFITLDDSIPIDTANAIKFYDKNILINNTSRTIAIQLFQKEDFPLIWQGEDTEQVINQRNAITYLYENRVECFYVNGEKIDIENYLGCASTFSLHYQHLHEALENYKKEKILHSSCSIFQRAWFDSTRIYFKNAPEDTMQESLKEYLSSYMRGVEVSRECNLGGGKPVDIKVSWKEANRAAIIEVKWLGYSRAENSITTKYSNSRSNDGMEQLKEYMDLANQDWPSCITKAYLVVIDGRRKGVGSTIRTSISAQDGLHFAEIELDIEEDKKYFNNIVGFEMPFRMFSRPVCV